jgi:hypothetical protein
MFGAGLRVGCAQANQVCSSKSGVLKQSFVNGDLSDPVRISETDLHTFYIRTIIE